MAESSELEKPKVTRTIHLGETFRPFDRDFTQLKPLKTPYFWTNVNLLFPDNIRLPLTIGSLGGPRYKPLEFSPFEPDLEGYRVDARDYDSLLRAKKIKELAEKAYRRHSELERKPGYSESYMGWLQVNSEEMRADTERADLNNMKFRVAFPSGDVFLSENLQPHIGATFKFFYPEIDGQDRPFAKVGIPFSGMDQIPVSGTLLLLPTDIEDLEKIEASFVLKH